MAEGTGGKPPDIPPTLASMNLSPDPNAKQPVLYSSEHKFSWYKLIIQAKPYDTSTANDSSRKPYVRALAVSKILGDVTNQSKDITEVRRLNRSKFLIICTTAGCANKIVQSDKVRNLYSTFIPLNYLTRTAILRDVDVEVDGEAITNEEIFNNIDCGNYKLLKVERLNRKVVVESKPTYVPSTSVKLVFDGQDMPVHVYLWYTRLQCEPFIQNPIQCFTCYKFGHPSKYCSTKSRLCNRCFSIESDDHQCDLVNLKCLNCHGPHNVNSKSCPEYERQKTIKIMMSTRNMCFPEAADLVPSSKQLYSVQTRNSFEVLGTDGADQSADFPALRSKNPGARREFTKYVPPPLPTKTNTFKRKPALSSAAPGSNHGFKKNKFEPQLFKDMRNLTKPDQYHNDKEIASMFYNNAKNNKSDIDSSLNLSQGTQSYSNSPVHQNTSFSNFDVTMTDPTLDVNNTSVDINSDGCKGPSLLGDIPDVRSPDLR